MIIVRLAISLLLLSCICHAGVVPSSAGGATAAGSATAYPADIIVLPDDGRKPILDLIQNAAESVWVCSYELLDEKIINGLCRAKQCGVDVRVMLEGKPYGSSTINTESAKKLLMSGIVFSWGNPQFTLTHANYIILDHRKLLLVTFDFTEQGLTKNRGYGVFIGDPGVVSEAEAVFMADWQKKEYTPVSSRLIISPDNSRQRLLELISGAKKKIWLQGSSLQEEGMIAALIEAKERGAGLKIILAETDINLKTQKYLSKYGISIKLQHTPCPQGTMILIDEQMAFVGSQALDARSLDDNREMGIIISYPRAVKRLRWMFSHD